MVIARLPRIDGAPDLSDGATWGDHPDRPGLRPWRYSLRRTWSDEPPLVVAMLNPSTADHVKNDPTITRCIGHAHRAGAGGLVVVNLFAWRSPYPADLVSAEAMGDDVVGPENNDAIEAAMSMRSVGILAAWGKPSQTPLRRLVDWRMSEFILPLAMRLGAELLCLGRTRDGYPRHPLYMPRDSVLEVWP